MPRSTVPSVGCSTSDHFHVAVQGTTDVWIDQANRARRIAIAEDESDPYTSRAVSIPTVDMTIDIKIDILTSERRSRCRGRRLTKLRIAPCLRSARSGG